MRIEAGKLQLSLEPVCLADALEEALSLMRPIAAERGTELSSSSEVDRTDYVMADRQRFKQVLLNLLTNAVKYTLPGGRVTVSYSSAGPATMRILVEDTGTGISEEKLARLFIPFDRLGAEQTSIEGTGLGLALCQRLMHAMNGTIGANSVPRCWRSLTRFWSDPPRTYRAPREHGSGGVAGKGACAAI